MKNKQAFTQIELLVVVLIIGILAAVAVPQYQKAVKKARLAEISSVFKSAQQAVDVYLLEKGFPTEETIRFTGTENSENLSIDLPGEKCTTEYNCINSGAYDVGCAPTHCGISLRTAYFKDGSTGNTWLSGEPFGLVLVPGSSQWVLAYVPKNDLESRKLICQWWRGPIEDYTKITTSFAGKTRCAEVGIN